MNETSLYRAEYFLKRSDPRREIAYQQDADKIKKRITPKSILDIGGGYGEFGRYFDCSYWCYDPFTGNDMMPASEMLFDVVVFRGTLQHIYNPVETLKDARQRMSKDGMLAILATPDTDSIGYLRWGTLPALDPDRNWIPFGHRMLQNVLTRLGFVNIEFAWPYGKPYANPLKDLWSFIIGKPSAFPGNMMECFAQKG